MLEAFRVLEEEKHINKEDIIDAVVESLKSAYKRRYGQSESAVVESVSYTHLTLPTNSLV